MLKATSVNALGVESYPVSLEVNADGYILLPEDPDATSYNVYAPLKGFETTGPWYFKRAYRRGEARRARFTVVGLYQDGDLVARFCPSDPDYSFIFPTPADGQEYWLLGVNNRPCAIVKC